MRRRVSCSVALAVDRGEEVADLLRDLLRVGLQREVSGVEEADHALGDIPAKGLGALRQKERIVLPPDGKEGRLVGTEIVLKCRVEGDIALVVAEQIELHLVRTRPRQVVAVQGITVRGDTL